jgi:hypothetical protein
MDTSAGAIRKAAVTDAEKEKYKAEGRCFKCGKQGHLSRNCPDRQTQIRSANATDLAPPQYDDLAKGEKLADYALKLSAEERDVFLKKVSMAENESEDFHSA